jgi:hypothetical protein
MFRRLVFENSAAIFTLAAFITAVSIYLTITWRALRMKRPQVARFANLPFDTATPGAAEAPAKAGDAPAAGERS